MDQAALEKLQKSMEALLQQNKDMNDKITKLQEENENIRKTRETTDERVSRNVKSLQEANASAKKSLEEMIKIKDDLVNDGWNQYKDVDWFFDDQSFRMLLLATSMEANQGGSASVVGEEVDGEVDTDVFDNVGREEKLDLVFGLDGDLSAKSLRRFIEKFKVVKKLNMTAKLRGWDSKEYRANKLKLALQGDAFDFVTFEDSMGKLWTKDDDAIISKLKDRYLNVQAIEMNILNFEKSVQEGKELLNEYLARLQQLVKDAYEGQIQEELDLRVAWKFVSGISDEKIRRKLMEDGWMKSRREAKPLEELLKVAEIAKQTEEAVKAMKPETGTVSMLLDDREGTLCANRFRQQSSDSTNSRAFGSSNSSGMALEFLQCFYCNKKHRGGWFYCEKRKKEDPKWKPQRKNNTWKQNSQSDRNSEKRRDF